MEFKGYILHGHVFLMYIVLNLAHITTNDAVELPSIVLPNQQDCYSSWIKLENGKYDWIAVYDDIRSDTNTLVKSRLGVPMSML